LYAPETIFKRKKVSPHRRSAVSLAKRAERA